jgi:hypothetical protein
VKRERLWSLSLQVEVEAAAPLDPDAEWEDDEEWEGDPLDLCQRATVRVPCYVKGTEVVMYVELQTIIVETKVALQPIVGEAPTIRSGGGWDAQHPNDNNRVCRGLTENGP